MSRPVTYFTYIHRAQRLLEPLSDLVSSLYSPGELQELFELDFSGDDLMIDQLCDWSKDHEVAELLKTLSQGDPPARRLFVMIMAADRACHQLINASDTIWLTWLDLCQHALEVSAADYYVLAAKHAAAAAYRGKGTPNIPLELSELEERIPSEYEVLNFLRFTADGTPSWLGAPVSDYSEPGWRARRLAPEDCSWAQLSPEQQAFFSKYLPATAARFDRAPNSAEAPPDPPATDPGTEEQ
jgi:hypothetical protein